MTLGEIIKKYRIDHDMSMDAFAAESGISKSYISILEKNKHPRTGKSVAPSIKCIQQAASCMGIDFNTLFNSLDGNIRLDEDTCTSTCDFILSDFEMKLIIEYRKADQITKEMVHRALGISLKEEAQSVV